MTISSNSSIREALVPAKCTGTYATESEKSGRSPFTKICAKIASIFRQNIATNACQQTKTPIIAPFDSYTAARELVKQLSSNQNPNANSELNSADLDFKTYAIYHVFTETFERYVPANRDNRSIDPAHVLVVKKKGPEGCILQGF